jgi:2-methylcitrate dehydratase PrpD
MAESIAEIYSAWAVGLAAGDIPDAVRRTFERIILDFGGLAVAARKSDYVAAAVSSTDAAGPCTAIGHSRPVLARDAALINGTAAHGEDFDDTFEGTPVHVGAVILPAVFAAAESSGAGGEDILRGLAIGGEMMCRLACVAPTAVHRAGFHPTAVIGTMGAAAGCAAVLKLDAERTASALGIAGSLASGIIEYLAEGTWTKRLHPGWSAQAGLKAAALAKAGFRGPRTVFEGTHGFFKAFADPSIPADTGVITDDLGGTWNAANLAFKPYACGTMVQPFIDCAVKLRDKGISPFAITEITALVGEGTVHRLWEPRPEKIAPSTPYSAKFSGPYGIAVGFRDGAAGLGQFTETHIREPELKALAGKVQYRIDPENEYPKNYTGELHVVLADGTTAEARQLCLRGGVHAPLSDEELLAKFRANTAFGGWPESLADSYVEFAKRVFSEPDLSGLAKFRE